MSQTTQDDQKKKQQKEQAEAFDQAKTQHENEQAGLENEQIVQDDAEQHEELNEQDGQQPDEDLSIEMLIQKVKEAEQKAEENYQKFLRAQADFDNFRRRTRTEKEEQAKYAALPLIEQLLPALDNFERALAASKDSVDAASLVQGVEMVFRQVEQVLNSAGLEVIPTVGQAFDPHIHQAVMQEESAEHDSGIVIEEFQKGYKLKDKVIRPAMVKVSS